MTDTGQIKIPKGKAVTVHKIIELAEGTSINKIEMDLSEKGVLQNRTGNNIQLRDIDTYKNRRGER